jgi:sulfite exporter TauE/SafE
MLHGLAGSGAMAAIVPLSSGQHAWQAALWLGLFGAGTIAAMAVIAAAAGFTLRVSARHSVRLLRRVVGAAGVSSILVGVLWLTNAP